MAPQSTAQDDKAKAEEAAKAAAEKAAAEEAAKKDLGKGKKKIKYIGLSDVREIDKAAWKNIGIDNDKVSFSRSNGFQMTDEGMSPEAVEYFDKLDEHFVVLDIED